MFITTVFTACTEFVGDNNSINENIGLPSNVNVMNERLANPQTRSGSDMKEPTIHTSTFCVKDKPLYLRYTTTPGIQLRKDSPIKTRGGLIAPDKFYDSYCLYTYFYQGSNSWITASSSSNATYLDEQVFKAREWGTSEFWPGNGIKCAFFAYAPYHTSGLTAFIANGWPQFHYNVPATAKEENDLLVTQNDISTGIEDYGNIDVPGNFYAKDYITFDHACTAIRFAIGKQMAPCTIKKIEIQNVYGEGDYLYQKEAWANVSTLSTYSLTQDFIVKATDKNVILDNDDNVFMMIPQKVPEGAVLAITIDDGVEHVLKTRIDDDIWLKGYTVTYYISTAEVNTDYVLSVFPASNTISKGTDVLTINSYKQTYYGSQVAVPWTATYTYDENGNVGTTVYNSTSPAVTGFTASSNGSISGENVNFTVVSAPTPQTTPAYRSVVENSVHTKALREAADGSCNLADGKQTANCYVIHAPGHYSFPLVYGNALNGDGTKNEDSYGTSSFVDHKGVKITSPYIYETNGGANIPYDACIVWQDAPHLITPSSLKLSSDGHSIEFDVERNNICQGNSVIAVRDKDKNILWSWQIWVTDYALTNTYEVHNDPSQGGEVISKFMEVPLGYCDAEVRVGDNFRNFHITFKQTDTEGETGIVSIQQYVAEYTYGINAPFYQWGRKDPMLPSNGIDNTNKPYYDNSYTPLQTMSTNDLKDLALYPYKFVISDSYGNCSLELWNRGNTLTTNNNNTVHKTIYDPAPTGYVEPKPAAFTGFTGTNVSGGWSNGWNFYCQINKTGGTIFFPAFGYRLPNNGVIDVVNIHGYCQSAGPSNLNVYSRSLFFLSGRFEPQYEYDRAFGKMSRPVLE